jgi:putative ABC transport system permease protein
MWFLTFVWKNIFRRKIRSVMTILGVAVAVGSMVALVGMSRGFERSLAEIYQKRGVDLVVIKAGVTQRLTSILDESIGGLLRRLPGVAQVYGGLVDVASFEGGNLIGVTINGVPPDSPVIRDVNLVEGSRLRPGEHRSVMMGKMLAGRLGKKVGDSVEIELEEFRIVGIFESYNVYENGSVILLLDDMQELMDRPGKVSGFVVIVDKAHKGEAAVRALCKKINDLRDEDGHPLNLEAMPTSDFVSTTVEIRTVKAWAWMTSVIALLIGGIAIFNTMIMSVFERTAEIGILRGIGWRRRRIIRLILSESVVLSLAGGVLGAVLAVVIIHLLAQVPRVSGFVSAYISPAVIAQGMGLGLVLGAIAGLYPAIRAALLLPTEAIRHE